MRQVFALLSGLIFGLGLVLSGMANPAKVLNFLDLAGSWDPSLAFVMGGAIAVTAPGFALLTRRRERPLHAARFHLPTARDLDPRLLGGAAVFGVGWGLGGFCPGPALTALPVAATGTLVFVPTMLAGMWLARRTATPRRRSAAA
ncbi:YeeE/YedE family protein [Rhodobacteraceae bacterium 2CG4]|uniref:YeeE/YedE family protein n=1 Tax=Halovulum marinum TaxID=2662447 RepID=A0A6L5YVY7_9RHOB|nr:YeeE/YedE family protein [Halovulum marinum]MSU88012.1 YeeE/YedE family protein [Halovulum marinum]